MNLALRLKTLALASVAAGALTVAGAAQAALVSFSFNGSVTGVTDTAALFGVSVGSVITVSGSYDDADLGDDFVDFDGVGFPVNNFSVSVGGIPYAHTDDVGFGAALSAAYLDLTGGVLNDFGFTVEDLGANDAHFDSGDLNGVEAIGEWSASADAFDGSGGVVSTSTVEGTWDFGSFTTSTVPEPGITLLLGLGLAGLGLSARRAKR